MSNMPGLPSPQKSNIVVLRKRPNPGRFVHTVYQEDLEEFLLLSRRMREAEKAWKEKRRALIAALRSGARVEPGIHEARLEDFSRSSYTVVPSFGKRLIVR